MFEPHKQIVAVDPKTAIFNVAIELTDSIVSNPNFDWENFNETTLATKTVKLATQIHKEVGDWANERYGVSQEDLEKN